MSDYIKSSLGEFHPEICKLQNELDKMTGSHASRFLEQTRDPKYEGRRRKCNREVEEVQDRIDQLKEAYKRQTGRNYDKDAALKKLIEESEEFWLTPATDESIVKNLKEVLNMDPSDPKYLLVRKQALDFWWAMIINKDKDTCCVKCCCKGTQSEMCKLAHIIFEFDPCECHTIENQAFKNLKLVKDKLDDLYYNTDTKKTDKTLSAQIGSLEKQLEQLQRRLTC